MMKNEKIPNKYPDLRYEGKKYKNKKQKNAGNHRHWPKIINI